MNERDIFLEALGKSTPAERVAFLDTACGDDRALRTRLEALLRSHDSAGEFLGKSAVERVAEKMASVAEASVAEASVAEAGVEEAGETEGAPAPPQAEEDLDFLAPSQVAGSLGRIGHYEVQEVIGRGGMGIVLRAFDERLHRVVAIKVMAPHLATSAAARKRFSKEAQSAAAICHDHIVTIHAVDEANGLPYLVMQYVAGVSLQERITRSGSLQLQEILRIGMQTASGLAAAHAQGLIHRDVKPANILLENGVERVKITDFGLARAVADSSTSQSGMIAGTPQYMSPEQARGDAMDRRADLFSLGSVLYAMCTGRAPFRGANSIAVLKRVCEEAPASIRESNPEIPAWLAALVEKLHAKDPAKRYQTAAEVAEILGHHLAEVQHPSVATPLVLERSARVTHSKRWAVAAAVLLLLLAGFGMAEGTGVTKLTSTVIRLLTPEGTLVVEVTDPGVKITIDGDGGLVITGAGLHEVRLKPGNHRIQADKNGQKIALESELVSIAKGGRTVVRVKLETPPASAVAIGGKDAFVLLAAGKKKRFNTLAEAVQSANDGDIIEIRGNGPFVCRPMSNQQGVTIRAGDSFRPVIRFDTNGLENDAALFKPMAPLVLEGLDLQLVRRERPETNWYALITTATDAPLSIANCRFTANSPNSSCIWAGGWPVSLPRNLEIRNCELYSESTWGSVVAIVNEGQGAQRLVLENCLHVAPQPLTIAIYQTGGRSASLQLKHNTFLSATPPMHVWLMRRLDLDNVETAQPINVEAVENVFDSQAGLLHCDQHEDLAANPLPLPEAKAMLQRVLEWREQRNLFGIEDGYLAMTVGYQLQEAKTLGGLSTLKDWDDFWRQSETKSQQGRAHFAGRTLRAKSSDDLTSEDFRLRPDSSGYRAGSNGHDLGANVDLVGPGPAYERWKKTPEYEQWLTDSGQKVAAAKAGDDDAKRELAKWQGEWGNSDHGRLIIKGDRWSWHPQEGPEVVSTIKIVEVTDKMTHVLLLNTGLDANVRTIQAILRVDGDTLHNCGTIGSIRPTEFAQKAGYLYVQWKRVAKMPP